MGASDRTLFSTPTQHNSHLIKTSDQTQGGGGSRLETASLAREHTDIIVVSALCIVSHKPRDVSRHWLARLILQLQTVGRIVRPIA